jgi:hypothetical protein
MSLSDTRRKLRIQSLLSASDMIYDLHQGGMTPEEMDMTEDEFEIFCQENVRTSKVLLKLAGKLFKQEELNEYYRDY